MALCDLSDAQRAIWLSSVEEQAQSWRKVIACAMAMAVLLAASAGFGAGLTRLHGSAVQWLVFATLGSLFVLVQTPVASALLNLRPLHLLDWVFVVAAFSGAVAMALVILSQLGSHTVISSRCDH